MMANVDSIDKRRHGISSTYTQMLIVMVVVMIISTCQFCMFHSKSEIRELQGTNNPISISYGYERNSNHEICDNKILLSFNVANFYFSFHMKVTENPENNEIREDTSENNANSTMPKVLIYITSHFSTQHKEYIKYCWPLALKNSYLLNSSDIMVYMTPNPGEIDEALQLLNETFKEQNLITHIKPNPVRKLNEQ